MKTTSILATLTLACAFSGGCATTDTDAAHREEEKCGEVKPGVITSVNSMCVIMAEDPVNPALETAEWRGQKVGFCCKGCVPRWNKMTDQQKDAALAAVTKAK